MSKGLEALKIVKQRLNTIRENTKIGNRRIADEENEACIKCIETCLSDIEKELKEKETPTETFEDFVGEPSEVIYKKLKALEIIKKKQVDVSIFIQSIVDNPHCGSYVLYCAYNSKVGRRYELTPKEYNLLNEVLENE